MAVSRQLKLDGVILHLVRIIRFMHQEQGERSGRNPSERRFGVGSGDADQHILHPSNRNGCIPLCHKHMPVAQHREPRLLQKSNQLLGILVIMVAQYGEFPERRLQLCEERDGLLQILGIAVDDIAAQYNHIRVGRLNMRNQSLHISRILVESEMHIAKMNELHPGKSGGQLLPAKSQPGCFEPAGFSLPAVPAGKKSRTHNGGRAPG
ncbi:hypothetical protein D3C71_1515990 [compost metagenome]